MKLRDDGPARTKGSIYGDRSLHAGAVTKWRFQATSPRCAHDSRIVLMSFLRRYAAADADLFTTELILGELLTNTVEHAPGPVDVQIDWSDDQPTIRVRDSGPGFDTSSHGLPENLCDENGRGLFLIRTLAEDVRIGPAPGSGTEITVRLPVSRAMRSSLHAAAIAA